MKKGFITFGVIISVLIVSTVLISLFFNPMINTTSNVKKAEDLTQDYNDSLNAKERLYSKFKNNVSFEGEVDYEDLDSKYEINTKNENYEKVNLTFQENRVNKFKINNETDIILSFDVSEPLDPDLDWSYNVDFKIDDKNVLQGIDTKDLTTSTEITVDKEFLYNRTTDETNYGEYVLSVTAENCYVLINVTYDKLKDRELSMINDGYNSTIKIDNNENIDIYFTE